jgi:uncharacterized protein YecT (DUF1311 family)
MLSSYCYAEGSTPEIKNQAQLALKEYKTSVLAQPEFQDASKDMIEFCCDTFQIETEESLRVEKDPSTLSMTEAADNSQSQYDKLLNKYYQKLLKSLKNENDKNTLKTSQQNWVKFRDSEFKLKSMLCADPYGGGGTIQQIIYSDYTKRFVKSRVIQLFEMLNGVVING